MTARSSHRIGFATAVLALMVAACDAGSDGSGTSTSSGSGGSGGDADGGSTSTTPGTGGSGGVFNPTGSGGAGADDNCLETSQEGTISPLDIIVLLDRSASMQGALWDGSVSALTSFFQMPGGADVSAALSYFPPPGSADECQPASYEPPHVPIVDLATSAGTLVTDLGGQSPAGDYTPTKAALYGTLVYANDYQDLNPDHVVVVVLASDGDPNECRSTNPENIADIAALAATALNYNGVRTYVVAIAGATVSNLDQIAAAGGTGAAIDVTSDIMLFQQAMDDIRREVLACEFVIPEPEGQDFDPSKVNVEYTPGNGDPTENLPQADNLADCGDQPGWYYDNPSAPTKIILCPASCDIVQADDMAGVDFIFGCPTIVN